MSITNLIKGMNDYYRNRVPHHDEYMSYTDNLSMERLLAPVIERIEEDISNKDILEIACGTGNWTQVLSRRARSVVATDLFEGYLAEARRKEYENVIFKIADAYTLEGINGNFNVAFAADWWSHIPRSKVTEFIETLHSKLLPGSRVVMIDMLPSSELDKMFSHFDDEGNLIQKRTLPNGKEYMAVKNFPKENELKGHLEPYTTDVNYCEYQKLLRWILTYTIK